MGDSRRGGYYGPSERDLDKGCMFAFLIFAALIATCIFFIVAGLNAPEDDVISYEYEYTGEHTDVSSNAVMLDTSDSWLMHSLGLPTRSDLLGYHMYGHWGYSRYEGEGDDYMHTVHSFEYVPGSLRDWDELYGLDYDNPSYKYPLASDAEEE